MKIYCWLVGLAIIIGLLIGVVLPGLISSNSSELFLIGVVLIIVSIPLVYFIGKKIYKEIQNAKI